MVNQTDQLHFFTPVDPKTIPLNEYEELEEVVVDRVERTQSQETQPVDNRANDQIEEDFYENESEDLNLEEPIGNHHVRYYSKHLNEIGTMDQSKKDELRQFILNEYLESDLKVEILSILKYLLTTLDKETLKLFSIRLLDRVKFKQHLPEEIMEKIKLSKGKQSMNDVEFFYLQLEDFIKSLSHDPSKHKLQFINAFLSYCLFILMILQTRNYSNYLLRELELYPMVEEFIAKHRSEKHAFLMAEMKELNDKVDFYLSFEIDEYSQQSISYHEARSNKYETILQMQKMIFLTKKFNSFCFYSIEKILKGRYEAEMEKMTTSELLEFASMIGVDVYPVGTNEPTMEVDEEDEQEKTRLINRINYFFKINPPQLTRINSEPLYPNEQEIFNTPINMTTITGVFLTLHDYLLRNFELYKVEQAYQIRQDVQDCLMRLNPQYNPDYVTAVEKTVFHGWSRNCTLLLQFQINDVGGNRLTESLPGYIKCDISFNLERYRDDIREEWDQLRPRDTLYVITIEKRVALKPRPVERSDIDLSGEDFIKAYGIKHIRGCEIYEILDDEQEPVQSFQKGKESGKINGTDRYLRVLMDPNDYDKDVKNGEYEVYGTFNLVMRREAGRNHMKSVLETIRDLMQSEIMIPDWLQRVVLGYDVRKQETGGEVYFGYTFLNWKHLNECIENAVAVKEKNSPELVPPYLLTFPDPKKDNGKKRARDEVLVKSIRYSGFEIVEIKKPSQLKFTPRQVECIKSGSLQGLTMVVGPPGTGKTDVAVQIISNIYHKDAKSKIILITKSNQALDHLFEKITRTDIDPKHLLRLGHGSEELGEEWGQSGRIDSYLVERVKLLDSVKQLVVSCGMVEDHASTCEQSLYFENTVVKPKLIEFDSKRSSLKSITEIQEEFPFYEFLKNHTKGKFQLRKNLDVEDALRIVDKGVEYIQDLFAKVADIRPFELLRANKDRSNYLLVKKARIIAMTCTLAALKRREFIKMGLTYDTVIIEEAAQMLEIESFIPMMLQNHDTDLNKSHLQRVVLIGDDRQLPPIIQNRSLFANGFENSMFKRLINLGFPTIQLDVQFRQRKEICDLYREHYGQLKDSVNFEKENAKFNPGFKFNSQLINVEDYKGKGETFPRRYFAQNLGEAEYIVQMFMYMRLIGYPKEKIAILTTYNGQKELINDVLTRRCRWNEFFGAPTVETVDKFQGQECDFVLLSLVRTSNVGHIKDVRRLVVSMSRARLGLYVFCRESLFMKEPNLTKTFKQLKRTGGKLEICKSEKYDEQIPKQRSSEAVNDVIAMGKIVAEMAKTQLEN